MEAELHYEAARSALYWRELKAAFQAAEAVIGAVAGADRYDAARLRVRAPIAIPNAVDMAAAPRGPVRRNGHQFVFAAVGRLSPQKDPLTLIEAFGRLDRTLDWRLRVFGQGWLQEACAERTEALGLAGRVTFQGFDSTWLASVARVDAFVSATRYEGMSNAMLEAAAAASRSSRPQSRRIESSCGTASRRCWSRPATRTHWPRP